MSGVCDMLCMAMWAAAAGLMAWYVATMTGEVTYVELPDGRRKERSVPLVFKLLLPFAANLDGLMSTPYFSDRATKVNRTLISAGFEGVLSGREFMAISIMAPVALSIGWCVLLALMGAILPDSVFTSAYPQLCFIGIALFLFQPRLWLSGELKKRHLSIMKALPFVLDLLTLSVEAGMDFISALQRNCASRKLDALNEELMRMTKEIQLGTSRREALRNMATRVNQPDLKSVANALIQADELGVSIGAILRIQSDDLRSRRFDRAEQMAAKAPTKMLGPLMFCIFPAVFIILLGPVLTQAFRGGLF